MPDILTVGIGDFVHYVKSGGLAGSGQARKCFPALIMKVDTNDKLDLLIFSSTAPPLSLTGTVKGTHRAQGDSWHIKHEENQ